MVARSMRDLFEHLLPLLDAGEPFALGIITRHKGSSPQKAGAKAAFLADGRILGTLGGGCLEAEIQDRARRALRSGDSVTFELVLDHDFGWDDGLICGGKVCGVIVAHAHKAGALWRELVHRTVPGAWGVRNDFAVDWMDAADLSGWLYSEKVTPPVALWIAGSGHVAQAVARLAADLEFEVTVFDDRSTFANSRYFPERTRFRVDSWEKLLREPWPETPVFGLIVTRGHQRDALVLSRWVGQPFVFLGMIGSSRKRRLIYEQLRSDRIATDEQLARVACPVGLDLGSESVAEIAVSIVAQLIQQRAAWRSEQAPRDDLPQPVCSEGPAPLR